MSTAVRALEDGEWYCHCCLGDNTSTHSKFIIKKFFLLLAKNIPSLDKCRVCGRPDSYAQTQHLPLHDPNSVFLRPNQVSTVVDHKTIHDVTNVKWSALHFSASIGNCSLVNELANQGSVINAESEHGYC